MQDTGLLSRLESLARRNHARVGIGIGVPTKKMLAACEKASKFADVVLVGVESEIQQIGTSLEIIDTSEAPKTLVELLDDGKIDAAVRGTLGASSTLSNLKKIFHVDKIHRLALLTTADGTPFFLAPVGIDEGTTLKDKVDFICKGVEHINRLGTVPKVAIISGGRLEDFGRDKYVDKTLADAVFLVSRAKDMGIDAKHYGILVEDAIKEANFLLAPDGVSGNLIFRTLVFLGGGDGIGAPVLMEKVFIDTSRVGGHFTQSIMLASALVKVDSD